MPSVSVRNLPDATHRALRHRAKEHGVSTEAEIRAILEEAVLPRDRIKPGTELAAFGRKYGPIEFERDPEPGEMCHL
jgi:plasmid stability protein